jgi:hypothetical protein
MNREIELFDRLQAKAAWRVAVTQGLTLLGFEDWVAGCANYAEAPSVSRIAEFGARAQLPEPEPAATATRLRPSFLAR